MKTRDKIFFLFLILLDRIMGTDLVEKELTRRREKVARYEAQLAALEERLTELEGKLETIQLRLCLLYLRERSIQSPESWLRFDPKDPVENEGVDWLIEHMVKPRLAAIEEEQVAQNHYVYHLKPDWEAIRCLLAREGIALDPSLEGWLESK
ncbi:MAG: hypothetical protein ACUVV0_10655 [Anaerolineae bacterium]